MMIHQLKRIIISLWVVCLLGFLNYTICYAGPIKWLATTDITSTLTTDSTKVIDTSIIKWNPITEWSNTAVGKTNIKGKIDWLLDVSTTNYATILSTTLARIQSIVDWSLWLLAVICVIYLVYNAIIILFKFDDDKAQSEALNSIKTVAWVIVWIWLTWFIVSAAFYVVSFFGWSSSWIWRSRAFDSGPGGGGYSLEDDLNKSTTTKK